MDGIYVLETKDGFRVTYSCRYEELVSFDSNAQIFIVGNVAKQIFTDCFCYDKLEDALADAHVLARNHTETDDGIRIVSHAKNKTFKELIKHGKNN